MSNIKNQKAITLIALVITIVVLIILAAVAINLSLGNNGIFNRAKTAKEQYQNAQDYEEIQIGKYSNEIDSYVGGDRLEMKGTVLYKLNNPTWRAVPEAICSENLSNYTTVRIDFIRCWWENNTDIYPMGNIWLEKEDLNSKFIFSCNLSTWYIYNIFSVLENNKIKFDSAINSINNSGTKQTRDNQTVNIYRVVGYK